MIAITSICSADNLFQAWEEFRRGKRKKPDVQEFERYLEDNIFALRRELLDGTYKPQGYTQFQITDPKLRLISKASVRDRVLHQAIYRVLNPVMDSTFIYDSYSCRLDKGTHKGFDRLETFTRRVSCNYTRPCWALKMDVRKFFDTVDHTYLKGRLREYIIDKPLLKLLDTIIDSYEIKPGKAMPIGNLTSQLFANLYLDPLDKFVKHTLKAGYYIRYADDFVFLANNPSLLLGYLVELNRFINSELKMQLHPDKIILRKLNWGIDFVGYIARPHHSLTRRKTAKRILKKVGAMSETQLERSLPSFRGYLQHACTYKVQQELVKAANQRIASLALSKPE